MQNKILIPEEVLTDHAVELLEEAFEEVRQNTETQSVSEDYIVRLKEYIMELEEQVFKSSM